MKSAILVPLVSLAALVGACSSGGNARDGAPLDGTDAADTADDAPCIGPLAEVGAGCPATFDGSEAALPACIGGRAFELQSVWHCGELNQLTLWHGLGGVSCFYDRTSHMLVGATVGTDIGIYCGNRSLVQEAGRIDRTCSENAPTFMRDCTQTSRANR